MTDKRQRSPRRPTLRMVADLAGVSAATASYVFSGRSGGASGIAESTAKRVLEAADRLNYRTNTAARSIRTGRTGMILLSLHMLSDPWSLAVAEAVDTASQQHGLTTLILPDGDWYTALNRVESDVAYVGLMAKDDNPEGHARLDALVERGQRLVVFSETLTPKGYDVVRSDPLPGCALAVDHLLERHVSIGCLTAQHLFRTDVPTRYSVYLDRLAAAGIHADPAFTATYENTQSEAFAAAVRLLSADRRPTAIYVTTDFAAVAAIHAAHMLGLRVPHDIAISGVGNAPEAQLTTPSLTTVGPIDFYKRQAELIVSRALEPVPSPPRLLAFPWQLVPGASTDLDATPIRGRAPL